MLVYFLIPLFRSFRSLVRLFTFLPIILISFFILGLLYWCTIIFLIIRIIICTRVRQASNKIVYKTKRSHTINELRATVVTSDPKRIYNLQTLPKRVYSPQTLPKVTVFSWCCSTQAAIGSTVEIKNVFQALKRIVGGRLGRPSIRDIVYSRIND